MNVLITGGAGYIGSQTVRLMRACGYGVLVLDNLETGHRAAIGDTPLIEGDIRDAALLERVFRNHAIDAVIHFAAYKATAESMQRPDRYFDNNVAGTAMLLEAIHRASIRYLVFSSSSAIYGTPKKLPVSEEDEMCPENPYGQSKWMVEQMLKWYGICHGLCFASLRYFNAAGASLDGQAGEDWSTTANLIPLVLKAALGMNPVVRIFGTDYPTVDGTAIRDYIHVLDLADAHIRALEHLSRRDESITVNLGTGEGYSVKQVVDTAERITGVTIPLEYMDRRIGDSVAIYADICKVRDILKWQPRFGLESMIQSAWRWHSMHPDGYR